MKIDNSDSKLNNNLSKKNHVFVLNMITTVFQEFLDKIEKMKEDNESWEDNEKKGYFF